MAKEEKDQFITLNFRIQSEIIPVEKVNIHQPLLVAVQKALHGHDQGRSVEDWIVTYNGAQLDTSKKVLDLGLPDGATLKLTLKAGGGGKK